MELLRQLAAVGLVFGLLAAALWVLRGKGAVRWRRRAGAPKKARRLEALERLALSPQHALHLVRAADQVLLIATHSGGCTMLTQLAPRSPDSGPGLDTGATFAQRLFQ